MGEARLIACTEGVTRRRTGSGPTASRPRAIDWPLAALLTNAGGNAGAGFEHGSPFWLKGSVTKLLKLPPGFTGPPATRIETGTSHPKGALGTAKAIWSNPAQQPERPAAITVAG